MSLLPKLSGDKAYQENQIEFRGYNHTAGAGGDSFFDTENLTLAHYPVLSPRNPRGRVRQFTAFHGLHDKDGLIWADGTGLYVNGVYKGAVTDTDKRFVTMGAYVLIWPDKLMYDTAAGTLNPLGAKVSGISATFSLSRMDGDGYGTVTTASTAPENPSNGDYWLDTSDDAHHQLKVYSQALGMWSGVGTTYVKIAAAGLGTTFAQGDGVTISGVTHDGFDNADYVIAGAGDGWIVVTGVIDAGFTDTVTVERRVPDMDFLVESGNRVWGCSGANHEIYASKLGDPKNWFCYAGVSTDSYAATIGSDGPFTGAAAHLGYVLFFKEDCVHKVMGSRPANYQITETRLRGVKAGSDRSLARVSETLYYLSPSGVMRYDGGMPDAAGTALGPDRLEAGAAGSIDNRYYVSLKRGTDWSLYVFNQNTGMWLREDSTHAIAMARSEDELYFVDENGVMWSENGTLDERYTDAGAAPEGAVSWMAETGDFLMDEPRHGYIGRITLRAQAEKGAKLEVQIRYNSAGGWVSRGRVAGTGKRIVNLEAIPMRCDHFRLKLKGTGSCKVFSIARIME